MYQFQINSSDDHKIVEYNPNMLCLWHLTSEISIIDMDLWNVVNMKDVYVFFMAEDGMDLDEDLIWDAIRLLSYNE